MLVARGKEVSERGEDARMGSDDAPELLARLRLGETQRDIGGCWRLEIVTLPRWCLGEIEEIPVDDELYRFVAGSHRPDEVDEVLLEVGLAVIEGRSADVQITDHYDHTFRHTRIS